MKLNFALLFFRHFSCIVFITNIFCFKTQEIKGKFLKYVEEIGYHNLNLTKGVTGK